MTFEDAMDIVMKGGTVKLDQGNKEIVIDLKGGIRTVDKEREISYEIPRTFQNARYT